MPRIALPICALLAACAACTPAGAPPPATPPPAMPAPAPTAATAPAPAVTVPTRFQGEWNMEPGACGTALNDSRVVIGADTIAFHESSGPIRAAVTSGDELALISELSGEGERWLGLARYTLDAQQNRLTDHTDAAHPLVRYRCPPGAQGR